MNQNAEELKAVGYFSNLDFHAAKVLCQLAGEANPSVFLAVALASRQAREGHVCLELEQFAGKPSLDPEGQGLGDARWGDLELFARSSAWPKLDDWLRALARSKLVGGEGEASPLVLTGTRLYLRRYHDHELCLSQQLLSRAAGHPSRVVPVNREQLDRLLGLLGETLDRQRLFVALAVNRLLTIVSGGPGTGKTATVVKLLALLAEGWLQERASVPRVLLLAPTGKAAQRLVESVSRAKERLQVSPEVLGGIPEVASTIHRALGPLERGTSPFASRQLLADAVVVDEASMVDVALMRRLVDAVPADCRLVLLGDRHQLASVEAGSVLGDLCARVGHYGYSPALRAVLLPLVGEGLGQEAPSVPLADSLVELTHSYRFQGNGIGQLAQAIKAGSYENALAVLEDGDVPDVTFVELQSLARPLKALGKLVRDGYRPLCSAQDPEAALGALEKFRVLCAHRRGPYGVEQVGPQIEAWLRAARLLPRVGASAGASRWDPHQPLLITQNDYQLGLFNGDVGVVMPSSEGNRGDGLRAYFMTQASGLRPLSPSRLPAAETVFAMSIHKSQGSEFDEVVVILPEPSSPLLTRELLYTAVTRAKQRVVVLGQKAALRAAVERQVRRASGLSERLWGPPSAAPA